MDAKKAFDNRYLMMVNEVTTINDLTDGGVIQKFCDKHSAWVNNHMFPTEDAQRAEGDLAWYAWKKLPHSA